MNKGKARVYLGDGAYARWDGFNIILAVNHHDNEVVTLEPHVFESLKRFKENITAGYFEPCKKNEKP